MIKVADKYAGITDIRVLEEERRQVRRLVRPQGLLSCGGAPPVTRMRYRKGIQMSSEDSHPCRRTSPVWLLSPLTRAARGGGARISPAPIAVEWLRSRGFDTRDAVVMEDRDIIGVLQRLRGRG